MAVRLALLGSAETSLYVQHCNTLGTVLQIAWRHQRLGLTGQSAFLCVSSNAHLQKDTFGKELSATKKTHTEMTPARTPNRLAGEFELATACFV